MQRLVPLRLAIAWCEELEKLFATVFGGRVHEDTSDVFMGTMAEDFTEEQLAALAGEEFHRSPKSMGSRKGVEEEYVEFGHQGWTWTVGFDDEQ